MDYSLFICDSIHEYASLAGAVHALLEKSAETETDGSVFSGSHCLVASTNDGVLELCSLLNDEINALRADAEKHGDFRTAALCGLALLDADNDALVRCIEILENSAANLDVQSVGTRVRAGSDDDYDTGVVVWIIGSMAGVAWDGGSIGQIRLSDLQETTERWCSGHRMS